MEALASCLAKLELGNQRNFIAVVMAMMRMVMEIVMVIAVVSGMVFVMKVSAKEDNSNNVLPDNGDDTKDSDNV